MAKLTTENKMLIDKLTAEGKTISDIRKNTGIKYETIYNFVNRIEISAKKKERGNYKSCAKDYVDTGKAMPPVCKSELRIIASMELAELACEQMGLKPPVATLAERPNSYNANGWVRVGNKWVAGQPTSNDGMLMRQPVFRATNGFIRS